MKNLIIKTNNLQCLDIQLNTITAVNVPTFSRKPRISNNTKVYANPSLNVLIVYKDSTKKLISNNTNLHVNPQLLKNLR